MNIAQIRDLNAELKSLLEEDVEILETARSRVDHMDEDLLVLLDKFPTIAETEEFNDLTNQLVGLNLDLELNTVIESRKLVK